MAYLRVATKAPTFLNNVINASHIHLSGNISAHVLPPVCSMFKTHGCKFSGGWFTSYTTKPIRRTVRWSSKRARFNDGSYGRRYPNTFVLCALTFSFFDLFTEKKEEEEEDEVTMMIKYAILASQRGEDAKAEQLIHVALKAAQEVENQKAITYIYDLMANFALKNKQYQKAQTLFVEVLKRLLQQGMADDDNAVVEISLKLATIYSHLEDFEKAAQGFQFCIGTQERKLQIQGEEGVDEDTHVLWAMSHDWYARFLLNLGHYSKAKEHFLRAYDVCLKVKGPEDSQTAVLLNDLGSVCFLQQNYDDAIKYMQEAIRVGKKTGCEDLASFYVNLGTVYMQKGVFDKAEKYCSKGGRLAKAHKSEEAAGESSGCLETLTKLQKG